MFDIYKSAASEETIDAFESLCDVGQNLVIKKLTFISLLRHTKGEFAKKLFNLVDWQIKAVVELYGRVDEFGYRVRKESLMLIPRKNGKSEFAAALALDALFNEDEFGAEIYSAANTREQASLVFNAAVAMVRMNKALKARCKILESTKRIVRYDTNSFYRAISADASSADGFNASFVIYDELHEAKNRDLYDKLITSQGARRQPLFISITTAGEDEYGIWYELFDYSRKIVQGVVNDPSFYPVLFYLENETGEEWKDEKNWIKANPGIAGGFRNMDEMRKQFKRALEMPTAESSFRRLYLNQIVQSTPRWLDINKWKASAKNKKYEPKGLLKMRCFGALDLSSTIDITAFVLVFPLFDGYYTCKYWYFIPEDNIKERVRRDRVPYDVWEKQGYIITTPGDIIDYDFILDKIKKLGSTYNIEEIAYDRWNASKLVQELENEGFEMIGFGQGFASMSAPTKELQTLTLQKKFINGAHPVTDWMSHNMVLKMDPAGNVKPDKARSKEKIDGMVATIMALDRAIRNKDTTSAYEERGIRTI